MGAPITPQVTIDINRRNEHLMPYEKDGYHHKTYKVVCYQTYRKLKADLKRLMREYYVNEVHVCRSRRGEWGEWNEHWHLIGNKLVLGRHEWS